MNQPVFLLLFKAVAFLFFQTTSVHPSLLVNFSVSGSLEHVALAHFFKPSPVFFLVESGKMAWFSAVPTVRMPPLYYYNHQPVTKASGMAEKLSLFRQMKKVKSLLAAPELARSGETSSINL